MLENFFLFNGLSAISNKDGNTVIFSPYNTSVGVIKGEQKKLNEITNLLKKLGCFGNPSTAGPALPENFDLTLIVTNDCNLRCKYCFALGGEKQDYMSTKTAIGIVNKVFHTTKRKNIKISFFGGEPSLNFEVIKNVVAYVKKLAPRLNKGYTFTITSNGFMPSKIINFLIENEFVFIISSDGVSSIQDKLRPTASGKGSSRYVENTINILVKNNIHFKVRSTISNLNVHYMPQNVQYFSNMGVDTLHYESITHAGRANSSDDDLKRADTEVFIDNFIRSLNIAKKRNVSIINSSYMNFLSPSKKYCDSMAGSRLIGSYNGDISLCVEVQDCFHPYSSKAIVGKLNNDDSQNFLNEERYSQILNETNIDTNTDCKECFAKFSCGGGCPIKHYHFSGCEQVDPYRCSLTKHIFGHAVEQIYRESANETNLIYSSDDFTLYRMQIPGEIWMKRKTARISNVLARFVIA